MTSKPTRGQKVSGRGHPITVRPTGKRVVARVGDTVVVDTTAALTLQEASYPAVQYVPLTEVDPALLQPSGTHTYCPYKGRASYYSLVVPGAAVDLTDAVWTYPKPYATVAEIAGHVAFYPDRVDVRVEASAERE
jgi:uncharacterized protein (DUF427 family)